jgi:hypothetical protein
MATKIRKGHSAVNILATTHLLFAEIWIINISSALKKRGDLERGGRLMCISRNDVEWRPRRRPGLDKITLKDPVKFEDQWVDRGEPPVQSNLVKSEQKIRAFHSGITRFPI